MSDPNSSEPDFTACDQCARSRPCPCSEWIYCMAYDEFYDEDEHDCPGFERGLEQGMHQASYEYNDMNNGYMNLRSEK